MSDSELELFEIQAVSTKWQPDSVLWFTDAKQSAGMLEFSGGLRDEHNTVFNMGGEIPGVV